MVAFEFRNGFGVDLEVANTRPVGLTLEEGEPPVLGYFEGFVLMLPFCVFLLGEVYTEE